MNRANTGFELLAKTSASEPFPIEVFQDCVRNEIKGLHANILRYGHAVADDQLVQKTNDLLRLELINQENNRQCLEEQVSLQLQSEEALVARIDQLEKEQEALRAAVQANEAKAEESEFEAIQLRNRVNCITNDLLFANDARRKKERLCLEQEQEFCKYRADAVAHHGSLEEQVQQTSDLFHAKEREHGILQQDAADLRTKLKAVQANRDQLADQLSECESSNDALVREKNSAAEKQLATQASLRSAEAVALSFKAEKETLIARINEGHANLLQSKDAEAKLETECSNLQRQVSELQDAQQSNAKQIQELQQKSAAKVQQAKTNYIMELDSLNARLTRSENARKESQAKMREMEAAHKQQIGYHEQTTKSRYETLASESQQEREKLKAKHMQDLQDREQEAKSKISKIYQEFDKGPGEAGLHTSTTLVPNTQQSIEHDGVSDSPQQSQLGRTRKKVDRRTDSIMVVVPSSSRRTHADTRVPTADGPTVVSRRRKGSEIQSGYFDQEYEDRFGSQAQSPEQEAQCSVVDVAAEVVPETQELQLGQGPTAQFGLIESQVSVGAHANPDENQSDLSSIASEDLSEMLLDSKASLGRKNASSRHSLPSEEILETPARPQVRTLDASSAISLGRPQSQANTASRMAPLPAQDMRRRHLQINDESQNPMLAYSDRGSRANDGTLDCMPVNNATPKRRYAQCTSVHNDRASNNNLDQEPSSFDNQENEGPFKKARSSGQPLTQRPISMSGSYAPYTPAAITPASHADIDPSPSNVSGRRTSNRQSSIAGSYAVNHRLSSTRNTRSKSLCVFSINSCVYTDAAAANRYTDRFGQELDRR